MDSEEIFDQFNLSKVELPNNDEEVEVESPISTNIREFVQLWRLILLMILTFSTAYYLRTYHPVEIEDLWLKYSSECCDYIYNSTRCSIFGHCEISVKRWLNAENLNKTILDTCCYWYAPYTEWRIHASPFCNISCLHP